MVLKQDAAMRESKKTNTASSEKICTEIAAFIDLNR